MSQNLPFRKRDKIFKYLGTRSPTPAIPRPSLALAPVQVPAYATPHPASSSSALPLPGDSILGKALSALTPTEQEVIKSNRLAGSQQVQDVVQDAYTAAFGQKQACEDKRWQWTFRGRTVVLRDEADKVLAWIDRFKSTADVVANVDPIHIGLPWAGIRMMLEAWIIMFKCRCWEAD